MIRSIRWLAGIACAMLSVAALANLQTLRSQARAGVPKAEFELGELYQFGVGRPDHLHKALKWYRRAEAHHVARAGVLARRVEDLLAAGRHPATPVPVRHAAAGKAAAGAARPRAAGAGTALTGH
ncbi:MAG: SEL1-like repeat protein [Gammaproteobacteria bacterium]|nr:SEL1-like repeat protein [Gammaproteobacteria bacterium]